MVLNSTLPSLRGRSLLASLNRFGINLNYHAQNILLSNTLMALGLDYFLLRLRQQLS
jgi:hypothetical protein